VPDPNSQPFAKVTRALSWLILALMAAAAVYALWMAARNWSHIGV